MSFLENFSFNYTPKHMIVFKKSSFLMSKVLYIFVAMRATSGMHPSGQPEPWGALHRPLPPVEQQGRSDRESVRELQAKAAEERELAFQNRGIGDKVKRDHMARRAASQGSASSAHSGRPQAVQASSLAVSANDPFVAKRSESSAVDPLFPRSSQASSASPLTGLQGGSPNIPPEIAEDLLAVPADVSALDDFDRTFVPSNLQRSAGASTSSNWLDQDSHSRLSSQGDRFAGRMVQDFSEDHQLDAAIAASLETAHRERERNRSASQRFQQSNDPLVGKLFESQASSARPLEGNGLQRGSPNTPPEISEDFMAAPAAGVWELDDFNRKFVPSNSLGSRMNAHSRIQSRSSSASGSRMEQNAPHRVSASSNVPRSRTDQDPFGMIEPSHLQRSAGASTSSTAAGNTWAPSLITRRASSNWLDQDSHSRLSSQGDRFAGRMVQDFSEDHQLDSAIAASLKTAHRERERNRSASQRFQQSNDPLVGKLFESQASSARPLEGNDLQRGSPNTPPEISEDFMAAPAAGVWELDDFNRKFVPSNSLGSRMNAHSRIQSRSSSASGSRMEQNAPHRVSASSNVPRSRTDQDPFGMIEPSHLQRSAGASTSSTAAGNTWAPSLITRRASSNWLDQDSHSRLSSQGDRFAGRMVQDFSEDHQLDSAIAASLKTAHRERERNRSASQRFQQSNDPLVGKPSESQASSAGPLEGNGLQGGSPNTPPETRH